MLKGLWSDDAGDAGFFLGLLPGPRDRDGLPESLRFWKQWIEPNNDLPHFTVALLCGPSGSGKSSLIKAGLLPRLSPDVLPIYLEATADGTERELLDRLTRKLPRLESNHDIVSALTAIRRGEAGLGQRKLLLVLDQFEQWLHAHRGERGAVLTQALRQCDGERLQCLLMVREDFSMAVYRLLQELETPLLQGKNLAIVDLFDTDHAQRVLEKMGRAFGRLPAEPEELTPPQAQFVEGAVRGIAEDHRVVPVRLALFAEMFKNRLWTPEALVEVGGAEGVGRVFLEETFRSDRA
ncbi:MAG: ATP-binding protein, partial [Planctomycetaceae bacterium]